MASFRPSHRALQAPHSAAPSKYAACRGFTVYTFPAKRDTISAAAAAAEDRTVVLWRQDKDII